MRLNKNAYLLKKMISLIEVQKTGTPSQLSVLLGISRSQLYILIDELKSLGVDIRFDRRLNSFLYAGNKRVIVNEPVLIISRDELINTKGGFVTKLFPFFFLDGNHLT